MSYFTDESEYKSSGGVIDPLDIAGPRPTGGQEAGAYFDKTFNTDLLISESVNERRALEERMNIISEHSGIDTMEALKPHGYEEGFFSGKGDPWLSSGRSDDFEKAVEAYANANPDVKGKLFYGEGIRQRAKEIAQAEDKRTSKIIERGKNGWWPALVGSSGAYAVDPLFAFTQMVAPEIAFARLAAKGVQMGFGARVVARTGIDATAGFIYELPAQKLAVQPYKQSLGIEHSDSDVAMNVFLGTVLGGAFGGAFEGLAGGFRKLKTGEWTPKELNEWAAKERPNMPPEEQQALDMAMQAVEHEKLNPYGPEGRDKFNREMATFNERADTNERMPSEMELEKAATDMQKVLTPEEAEFQELRAYSREQAGIIDDIPEQAVKQPDANPLGEYEAQLRSITDGLEVGDDVALNTLTSSGIDEATARQAIDYAINNGILTKDADGKLTFARKVDDQNPVLKTDSEDTPKLNAETEKGRAQRKQLLQAMSDNFKIGDEFSSGFMRRMGFDRAQIDDFIDHGIETGYLSEKNGKLKVSRRFEEPPKEKTKTRYEIAQQERMDAAISFLRSKKAYEKAIDGKDALEIKEARKQLMIATNARTKARNKAIELDSDGLKKNSLKGEAVAPKVNDAKYEFDSNQFMNLKKTNPEMHHDLTQLKEDAARILPDDVTTLFPMFLDDAHGVYHRGDKIVMVARDHPDIETALRHEALHALRTRIKTPEWEMLVEASRKIEFPKEELYKKRLADSFEDLDDVKDILIRDGLNEERVANLIEYAYNGGNISILEPKPKNLIAKAVQYIKALITTLKAPKYNKLRTFLEDFENGIIAKRAEREDIDYLAESLFSMDENPQQQGWFTPEFKRWFGDSKVVDEDGNPLVVYHGTDATIDKEFFFDPDLSIGGQHWFTTDVEAIKRGEVGASGRGEIVEAHLSLQNPAGWDEYDKLTLDELIHRGYDGLMLPDGDHITFVAFDPEQIKSVNNRGTFDPNDPRIMYSLNENPQPRETPIWQTPAFKKWFAGSKVVDEDGNPLVVYHGTNGSFDEDFVFKHTMIGDNGSAEGYGFYFTDDRTLAEGYAKGDLGAFYLTIENPLNLQSRFTYDELSKIIDRTVDLQISKYSDEIKDYKETFLSDYVDTYSTDRKTAVQQVADMLHGSDDVAVDSIAEIANVVGDKKIALRATTDATGYDGVLARQTDAEGREYENIFVAFNAEQIKSVNNRGTFDPNDPRIMYSLKETPQPRGTPEGQNLTPEFKKWFAGSKVVDDEGKPLIVYHGTIGDIDWSDRTSPKVRRIEQFERRSGQRGIGFMGATREVDSPSFFFTADATTAQAFARSKKDMTSNTETVLESVYLSIKNPFDITKKTPGVKKALKEAGFSKEEIDSEGSTTLWSFLDEDKFVNYLKEQGYDGAITNEKDAAKIAGAENAKNVISYAAFSPEQIKSVNNRGTFDPNDPRIMYSLNENQKTATLDELTIDIDGQQMSVKELFKSADDDLAMAENIKLCASLGA